MNDDLKSFARTLVTDPDLQEQVMSRLESMGVVSVHAIAAEIAELAQSRGFDISPRALERAFADSRAVHDQQALSDEELDAVAGGNPDDAYAAEAKVITVIAEVTTTVAEVGAAVATTATGAPFSQIMSRLKRR